MKKGFAMPVVVIVLFLVLLFILVAMAGSQGGILNGFIELIGRLLSFPA